MNPGDAATRAIGDGDVVRITSPWGQITAPFELTDDMCFGALALPHGWGQRGGGTLAASAGGSNYNILAPIDPSELDQLSGSARLDGMLVRVELAG